MYPRLSDAFEDLFGFHFPIPIYSFGAMVAVGVVIATWLTTRELDRLYDAHLMPTVPMPGKDKHGRKTKVREKPSAMAGMAVIIAMLAGFGGARIFHILENFSRFLDDPVGQLITSGGFSFFGGLIVAGLALIYYVKSKGLYPWRFGDAVAPGLMIGYGIGRIGCHLSGDGDWGTMANIAIKPDWIPMWLWAETYPGNILGEVIPAPGVYPTPIYEFLMATVLFALLWAVRKHPFRAGWLVSLYAVFSGVERFLIEQIRVNNEGTFLGITATQAEVIAVLLTLGGIVGLILTTRRSPAPGEKLPA